MLLRAVGKQTDRTGVLTLPLVNYLMPMLLRYNYEKQFYHQLGVLPIFNSIQQVVHNYKSSKAFAIPTTNAR